MVRKICLLLGGLVFLLSCNMLAPAAAPTQTVESSPSLVVFTPPLNPTPTQDLIFDLNNLNQIPPDDIIAEVGFFGLPGGGGFNACLGDYKKPTLEAPAEVEIMQEFHVAVCQIPSGGAKVKIKKPDGTVTETMERGPNVVDLVYFVDLTQPIGTYQIQFSGDGWELSADVKVYDAPEPRLYLDYPQGYITFYHFQPNEKVRLFFYKSAHINAGPGLSLKGWKEYQMNESGAQTVKVGNALIDRNFVSVGESSGQVPKDWQSSYLFESFAIACGNNLKPLGIHPGDYVQVIADEINLVWRGTWETAKTVKKGDILQITGGPVCHDNSFYWNVSLGNIREADGNTPLVKVIKELPPTLTPDLSKVPACPGAKPTRLKPGIQAKVSKAATQLSLRDAPNAKANKIHVIALGRKMSILPELPVCANDAYWWHVYVDELGFGGWAREGDNEDYWIDPLP